MSCPRSARASSDIVNQSLLLLATGRKQRRRAAVLACRWVLIALGAGLAALRASATLLVDDAFSYTNGPLEVVAAGAWTNFSGPANQVYISAGQAVLSQYSPAE